MSGGLKTYTGVWTNWSHGKVRGLTLTLKTEHAAILVVFLALFVSSAGGAFWRLISFLLHQYKIPDRRAKRDMIFHQRQVVLRNNTAIAAAWSFGMIAWENLRKSRKPILRCIPYVVIALLNASLFAVAGLFTSAISRFPGNTTILLGPSCGGHNLTTTNFDGAIPQVMQKVMEDTNEAADYVRQCYQQNVSAPACGNYVRRTLPFTTNPNATCPFESGMCIFNDKSAFSMDTGLLNSHHDFGINAPPEERLLWRRMTTCAPIYASDFGTVANDSIIGQLILINAGPNGMASNFTFRYATHSRLDGVAYGLSTVYAPADPSNILNGTIWVPHPLLKRTDADVTLLMLSQNSIYYSAPVDDPWMMAHDKLVLNDRTVWISDNAVNLMGCAEQLQICSPDRSGNPKRCSKLNGKFPLMDELVDSVTADEGAGKSSWLNSAQIVTLFRFLKDADSKTIYFTVQPRGGAALDAGNLVYQTGSAALPANQWHKEVSIWFSTGLAKEQASAVEWATMPRNLHPTYPGEEAQWTASNQTSPVGRKQCRNQLVRSTAAYLNFSVLGMILILVFGGVIMLLGVYIDVIVAWLRRPSSKYKSLEWNYDNVLELQRALHATYGQSPNEDGIMPHYSVPLAYSSIPVYEADLTNLAVSPQK